MIVDCEGSSMECGLCHGEEARELIRYAIKQWEEEILSKKGNNRSALKNYISDFLNNTSLIDSMKYQTPDLIEEMKGIAKGSGISFEKIAAYNLMDEQWWYDLSIRNTEPGCSLIGIKKGKNTILGQNMDLPAFMDGSQIILRISSLNKPRKILLTSAGQIGLTGVNDQGIAVCVNTLLMLRSNSKGLPVAAVLRYLLEEKNLENVKNKLININHASGQHYAFANKNEISGYESSASGSIESSIDGRQILLHTNHPLVSRDINSRAKKIIKENGRIKNSEERLRFLTNQINKKMTEIDIIELLSDISTPLCAKPSQKHRSQTFGSILFKLSENVKIFYCLGMPGKVQWKSLTF